MTQKIIELKNVTKTFQFSSPYTKINFLSSSNFRKSKKTVIALDNISFSVDRGEILGIIGLNGSGKSTLLQTIAGLYLPDSGYVGVNGTLAPVLTIGAGFNQELLPTENIVLYGMLLGLSKSSIKEKIDRILQFAELEKFSSMKLKHFSTGMKSRLAVSTIFQLDSDILLLDEILAVGDIKFRQKCIESFSSFVKNGKTILHATHSINTLTQFCDRVLLLHMGKIILIDKPEQVIKKYQEIFIKK